MSEKTRQVGLEPTTSRLTAGCSTIELLPKNTEPPRVALVGRAKKSIGSIATVKLERKQMPEVLSFVLLTSPRQTIDCPIPSAAAHGSAEGIFVYLLSDVLRMACQTMTRGGD